MLWPFRDAAGRAALGDAFGRVEATTVLLIAALNLVSWVADSTAIGISFRAFGTKISLPDALLVRGATLLFESINPSVGQIALGVAMARRGTPLPRLFQSLAVVSVVFILSVVCVAGIGLLMGHRDPHGISAPVVVTSLCVAFAYLLVVALRPPWLAKTKAFGALVDAGVRGHAIAFVARMPSIVSMFVTVFATMRAFGIHAPASAVLVYAPAIFLITGTPISIQGLGPAQLAQVAVFAQYVEAEPVAARATVLAWGLATSFGHTITNLIIGSACLLTKVGREAIRGRNTKLEDLDRAELKSRSS